MEKSNQKSILEMARGAIQERADYEMSRIIDNIGDVNTAPTKKRTLTLTVEFTPNAERDQVAVSVVAQSKLQPTNAVTTSLYIADGDDGVKAYEMVPQIPGQQAISGKEQEAPAILRLYKNA